MKCSGRTLVSVVYRTLFLCMSRHFFLELQWSPYSEELLSMGFLRSRLGTIEIYWLFIYNFKVFLLRAHWGEGEEWRWKPTFSTWSCSHDEPEHSFHAKSTENEALGRVLYKTFEIVEKYWLLKKLETNVLLSFFWGMRMHIFEICMVLCMGVPCISLICAFSSLKKKIIIYLFLTFFIIIIFL